MSLPIKIKHVLSLLAVTLALISPLSCYANGLSASTPETMVWHEAPLSIDLPVGQERYIHFPQKIQFGYDTTTLNKQLLRVENDNQTLYLTAHQTFHTQRVFAKLGDGQIVLIDLSASSSASSAPINVALYKQAAPATTQESPQAPSTVGQYATLIRYVSHQFYEPKRLLKENSEIYAVNSDTKKFISLTIDGSAIAEVKGAWRYGGLYATAVMLRNRLHTSLALSHLLICGKWDAYHFYMSNGKRRLSPAGTTNDTSLLVLISKQPFSTIYHQQCLAQ